MMLRLWTYWQPKADPQTGPFGYHLEVVRAYDRVPIAGETIDLPTTRFGTAHAVIERVGWDHALPNLTIGDWMEADGAEVAWLTEAGFHQSADSRDGCLYCRRGLGV